MDELDREDERMETKNFNIIIIESRLTLTLNHPSHFHLEKSKVLNIPPSRMRALELEFDSIECAEGEQKKKEKSSS